MLVIELLPGPVAVAGLEDDVGRPALDARHRLQAQLQVLGVVAAPVETFGAADPLLLAAAVQLALVRAQSEESNLVGIDVAQQPFVGVQAVVIFLEDGDGIVDRAGILDGLADARGLGQAADVEAGLGDDSFASKRDGPWRFSRRARR